MHITQGCHPRGDRLREQQKSRGGPRTNFSVVVAPLVYGHRSNFHEKMSKSPDSLPNVSCFDLFLKNPKGCKIEVIQGAHKFMTHVIKGTEQSPKNSTFIGLFNQFTKVPVKDYVFTRMTKAILQELALCVLQELILYGPARAQNLTLVVVETKAGGKTVAIEKDEFPVSPEFVSDIDEAFFKLSDITGFSPDKQVASGQGHDAPYVLPNPDGFFTSIKAKRKSLGEDFQVS